MAATAGAGAYQVGPEDILEVQVGDEPRLSGDFTVSDEGSIVYPLLGAVAVSGKDVTAVAELIRSRLAADYLVAPQVAVYVKTYRSKKVAVLGDVPTPGIFILMKDSSLLSILSEAGVRLSDGDKTVIITRAAGEAPGATNQEAELPVVVKLDKLQSPWHDEAPIVLTDGDRVYVKADSAGKIFISGKVKRPGTVPMTPGMTLMEAINQAGGIAEFGSLKGIRVIRESHEGAEVLEIDVSAVLEGDRGKDIAMQDGDIVVVPRRWF
jgi:polysaccharide biosynthesis/export protein